MADVADVKKILVRAPNWIGDAVMCLPAIESLKGLFPEARITVLTRPHSVPVFENNPCIKGLKIYDSKGAHSGLTGRFRLADEIKKEGFGLAVLFQNAFDAAFIAYRAGVPQRVGFARDLRSLLLTKPVRLTREIKKRHHAFYYLNIVKALGGEDVENPVPRIFVAKTEAAEAKEYLKEKGLEGVPLAGVAPGASYGPAKRWHPAKFALVLTRLALKYGVRPVVFGGAEDAPYCEEVMKNLGAEGLNLAGKIGLRQFVALMPHFSVFISNDSGPMHLSAAIGTPTVALFFSTNPGLTGPLGTSVKVVYNKVICSPCFERKCHFKHYNCLSSMTEEEVAAAAESIMDLKANARPD